LLESNDSARKDKFSYLIFKISKASFSTRLFNTFPRLSSRFGSLDYFLAVSSDLELSAEKLIFPVSPILQLPLKTAPDSTEIILEKISP
jgi:hypothetical protein